MKNIKDIQKEILEKDLTNEEFLELNKILDEMWDDLSEEEREDFIFSGAGDALEMALEYM